MSLKVKVIKIMSILFIINIIISIGLEFELDKLIFLNINNRREFFSNIFISILTSILTILIMSFIEYNDEKRKCLEDFYIRANMIIEKLQKFEFLTPESQVEFLKQLQNIDFQGFHISFSNIHFIKNNNYENILYKEVYEPIMNIKTFINYDLHHLENYCNTEFKCSENQIKSYKEYIIKKFQEIINNDILNDIRKSLDDLAKILNK